MIKSRQYLTMLIDEFLAGRIAFDAFAARYSDQFIDEMPENALDDDELEWFGAVHEKIEWTSPAPDPESRRYGWVDIPQFRQWLRTHAHGGRA